MDDTITKVIDNMREQARKAGLPHKVELTQEEKEAVINYCNRIAERLTPVIGNIIKEVTRVVNNMMPAFKVLLKLKQEEQARAIHRAKIQRLKKKRNKKPKLSRRRAKKIKTKKYTTKESNTV